MRALKALIFVDGFNFSMHPMILCPLRFSFIKKRVMPNVVLVVLLYQFRHLLNI